MRMSCNGCRVLRKGCSDNCVIRPCLHWIPNAEAQANATVFLAKFYGRAGLINLIAGGPEHQRPAIFRSLLYEACGRILNPIYGSVGLLWSGNWQMCQAAVESILKGRPISAAPAAATASVPLLKSCDIRHVAKSHHIASELHRVSDKSRSKFKQAGSSGHNRSGLVFPEAIGFMSADLRCETSHESGNRESNSHVTVETVVDSHVSQAEPSGNNMVMNREMGLDLTLGLVSVTQSSEDDRTVTADEERSQADESKSDTSPVELGLTVPVPVAV